MALGMRVQLRAQNSLTPSGSLPSGGAVTGSWGVPNTPGGCRDRGGSVQSQWHCWGHCWDITAAAVGREVFSLSASRVPAVGTDPF